MPKRLRSDPIFIASEIIGKINTDGRCGLFHSGMIKKRIIINNKYRRSIEFVNDDIKISPSKLLADIKIDFRNYIVELQNDYQLRSNFNNMFTNI